jgi:hypothetical protein
MNGSADRAPVPPGEASVRTRAGESAAARPKQPDCQRARGCLLAHGSGGPRVTARAFSYRGRLGDEAGSEVARTLAAKLDNAALLAASCGA